MIGARELGAKLGRQRRFVARVCHERGVGERSGGSWETRLNKAARARQLVEPGDLAWFDLVQRVADSVSVRQGLEDPPNEFYTELSAARATHGAFDDRRKMTRDRERLLGLVNSAVLGPQIVLLLELLIELIRQQRLVYPPVHEPDVSGSRRQCWSMTVIIAGTKQVFFVVPQVESRGGRRV
jgi:hypothetical protein